MSLACASCPVRDRAACAVLAPEERAALAEAGHTRTLARGQTLFAAGDPVTSCATLVSGALKIASLDADGSEHILALVHPSGFVGEFFQPFAAYDVIALADSRLCVFAGPDMDSAIARYPALSRALLRRAQEDLHASRALLAIGSKTSARARVAAILIEFARAASDSPCHPARTFDLPLSRGDLARTGKRGIELIDPALLSAAAQ